MWSEECLVGRDPKDHTSSQQGISVADMNYRLELYDTKGRLYKTRTANSRRFAQNLASLLSGFGLSKAFFRIHYKTIKGTPLTNEGWYKTPQALMKAYRAFADRRLVQDVLGWKEIKATPA